METGHGSNGLSLAIEVALMRESIAPSREHGSSSQRNPSEGPAQAGMSGVGRTASVKGKLVERGGLACRHGPWQCFGE